MSRAEGGTEWAEYLDFVATEIDPQVRRMVEAGTPWSAYEEAQTIANPLLHNDSFFHHGSLYVVWQELSDLFETGLTPIDDAQAVLRQAGQRWLHRGGPVTPQFFVDWLRTTGEETEVLFRRDGTFRSGGSTR